MRVPQDRVEGDEVGHRGALAHRGEERGELLRGAPGAVLAECKGGPPLHIAALLVVLRHRLQVLACLGDDRRGELGLGAVQHDLPEGDDAGLLDTGRAGPRGVQEVLDQLVDAQGELGELAEVRSSLLPDLRRGVVQGLEEGGLQLWDEGLEEKPSLAEQDLNAREDGELDLPGVPVSQNSDQGAGDLGQRRLQGGQRGHLDELAKSLRRLLPHLRALGRQEAGEVDGEDCGEGLGRCAESRDEEFPAVPLPLLVLPGRSDRVL
mmetsp:Transcript_2913/g.10717  ORF Transcript_2913/g.10717 Transcript_2913/m.10717 type:complete len:264 (-) Transcript_2913:5988-6779(-)